MSDLFEFSVAVPRFAVMGNPVNHSKSPRIHAWFGEQTGIALEYSAIQVDAGGFEQAVEAFKAGGGRGLNVTVPFKADAWNYADERTQRAQVAGAVNTLAFGDDGTVLGDNTDGSGLVRDIQETLGVSIAGRTVLIIGAGGATRGVIQPVTEQSPACLFVANRTPDRAVQIVHDLNPHLGVQIEGGGLESVGGRRFDIVINATAASLSGEVPDIDPCVVDGALLSYDMMYADEPTSFIRWADEHGSALTADGLGMLVEQAADAFDVWHGVRPECADVCRRLRDGA